MNGLQIAVKAKSVSLAASCQQPVPSELKRAQPPRTAATLQFTISDIKRQPYRRQKYLLMPVKLTARPEESAIMESGTTWRNR